MNKRAINTLQTSCNKIGLNNIIYQLCNSTYKTCQEIRLLQYIDKFIPKIRYDILPRHARTCDVLNWLAQLLKEVYSYV